LETLSIVIFLGVVVPNVINPELNIKYYPGPLSIKSFCKMTLRAVVVFVLVIVKG
jgi:hypothetical protein